MSLITPGIKKLIEGNALALATVGADGRPHVIAVAYVVVAEDRLVVTDAHINDSITNIAVNPQVALAVWNPDWETACVGFELRGRAEVHRTGQWFELVKNLPDNEGYEVRSAIVVAVEEVKKLLS